ncbi:MAG: tRNA glutamyl-Q(34) synthetase GluQRS [Proteobacteria bacterium]|nr:MAG: tRNA glutamyl-Q(34) synthetase GluQRS [Pseudomonadota bacterium]
MSKKASVYRGRFAPSPSGDLHFGSLLAALVSYCDARSHNGYWYLRIEDVDSSRTVVDADLRIFKTLQAYELAWDGQVIYQTDSKQQQHYQKALEQLTDLGLTYRCRCTRKQLSGHSTYPGHCRLLSISEQEPHSIRLITDTDTIYFNDSYQGPQQQHLQQQCGDFNIVRKDGLFSYQLAVVIDDHLSGINHVVRGIDILDSTARQIYLHRKLGLTPPAYAHFPIVVNQKGHKLSKQNHATAVSHEDPTQVTRLALNLLNQDLPHKPMTQQQLIQWAVDHWLPERFKGQKHIDYGVTP